MQTIQQLTMKAMTDVGLLRIKLIAELANTSRIKRKTAIMRLIEEIEGSIVDIRWQDIVATHKEKEKK